LVVPSAAIESRYPEWSLRLLTQGPETPISEPLALTLHLDLYLYLKGKIDQDLDNAVASVLDLFQDAGIIQNDKQVMELHLFKHPGATDFSASVTVEAV
jgi:Holliday junction resolvase RusA-like endonuclease